MCYLRKILNIKWWKPIPNKFMLEKNPLPDMYDILFQCNLRWAGNLNRLRDSRLAKLNLEKGHKKANQNSGIRTSYKNTGDHEEPFRGMFKNLKKTAGKKLAGRLHQIRWTASIYVVHSISFQTFLYRHLK